jgi:predicted lipid-binding transport protein (Tim44 family)
VTEVWETGDLVITALLLWLIAGALLVGLLCAAVGSGTVWAWRRIRAQAGGRPRRGLAGPRSAELPSSASLPAAEEERPSEPPMRKEAA